MNSTTCKTFKELAALIEELANYNRGVCYKLSEIKVIQDKGQWKVFWQKDPS